MVVIDRGRPPKTHCKRGHKLPEDRWRERTIGKKIYRVRDCTVCQAERHVSPANQRETDW